MAGNVNLTQTQMMAAIALLLDCVSFPVAANCVQNGVFIGGDGNMQFPDNAVNEAFGQTINAFTDGTNIHLGFVNAGAAAVIG
jgi:hypothetical protein